MSRAALGLPLQLLLAGSLAFGVGVGLGFLSRGFYVIGLLPLALGLLAGAAVGFIAVMTGGPWRLGARFAAVAAIVIGWCAFQYVDDYTFQHVYQAEITRVHGIVDEVPPELLKDPDALAFLGKDASQSLDDAVRAEVGQSGFVGRWLFRAERGVRLVGPFVGGRGLPLGTAGAIVWGLLELGLAKLLAVLVIRRIARAAHADPVSR